jgi:hypothetical protein
MDQWATKVLNRADDVVREATALVFEDVVMLSPVKTGRFRANWLVGRNFRPTAYFPNVYDPAGTTAKAHIRSQLSKAKAGDTIHLVNNAPYATMLELGWSQQAPAGMVRIASKRFTRYVAQVAEKKKNDRGR